MKIILSLVLILTCLSDIFSQAGQPDGAFGTAGRTVLPFAGVEYSGMVVQPDGKVVIASKNSNNLFTVIRLNADGTPDLSFDGDGIVTTAVGVGVSFAYDVALQADGKIVVVGRCEFGGAFHDDFGVVRYNTNGSLDLTFDGDGIVITDMGTINDFATGVVIQPDGKIVVTGTQGVTYGAFNAARYNTDGSLDNSFSGDGKYIHPYTSPYTFNASYSIAFQPDGKIVLGGYGEYNGPYGAQTDFAVVRINPDGTSDLSFNADGVAYVTNGSSSQRVEAVAIQADGKIVAAGYAFSFTTFYDEYALLRFNTDGTLDNSFDGDGITYTSLSARHDKAFKMAIQADNKIIASGYSEYQDANSDTRYDFSMARYNPDGSLDPAFGNGGRMVKSTVAPDEIGYAMTLSGYRIFIAGWADNALAVDAFINDALPLVLPVKLTSFTASRSGNVHVLNWQTSMEHQSSHFEIERSGDGLNYTRIGSVNAAGNSIEISRYNYTDMFPLPGVNFYRLKMVDIDNRFAYSKVIALQTGKGKIKLFPNPVITDLHMQLKGTGETTYRILSVSGLRIKTGTVRLMGETSVSIDVRGLPPGQYILQAGDLSEVFIKR